MKGRPDAEILVWGSELRLHDAGRNRGDGWADLLTLDETGRCWIIEVKLSTNTELSAGVWDQLIRYRNAAQTMSWPDIQNYADRYLDGEGRVKPASPHFAQQMNLVEVVKRWQEMLGRTLVPAEDLVAAVATSLAQGTVGLAVVADAYRDSVMRGAKGVEHAGALAYIALDPQHGQMKLASKFVQESTAASDRSDGVSVDAVFYKHNHEKKPNLNPSSLEEGLNPAGLAIWRQIAKPALLDLGWDGSIAYPAQKGMTLNVICRGMPAAIVRLAFSDADGKGIDRRFKAPGTYGLRVDFTPWYIKEKFERPDITKPDVEAFAKRLHVLGWRGSGKTRATAGVSTVPPELYQKWSYMRYYPSSQIKDFLGRDDDPEKVTAFFREMKVFCRG
jgi:hypothetical protein